MARVFFASRKTPIDFTLFTMINARARTRPHSRNLFFFFSFLFRCQSPRKARITFTKEHLIRRQRGNRRGREESIRHLVDRFREGRNRDRVDLLQGILGIRCIRTNRMDRLYNGAITPSAITCWRRADRIFPLRKTVAPKLR